MYMSIDELDMNVAMMEYKIISKYITAKVIGVLISTKGQELASAMKYIEDINFSFEKVKLSKEEIDSTNKSIEEVHYNVVYITYQSSDLQPKFYGIDINVEGLNREKNTQEKNIEISLLIIGSVQKQINQLKENVEGLDREVYKLIDMISQKEENITLLSGLIMYLTTEVIYNCVEVVTDKKKIVEPESHVAEPTVIHY